MQQRPANMRLYLNRNHIYFGGKQKDKDGILKTVGPFMVLPEQASAADLLKTIETCSTPRPADVDENSFPKKFVTEGYANWDEFEAGSGTIGISVNNETFELYVSRAHSNGGFVHLDTVTVARSLGPEKIAELILEQLRRSKRTPPAN